MKAAVVQMNTGPDKARNLGRAEEMLAQAARRGAKLVLFPEVFIYRGPLKTEADRVRVFEPVAGPTIMAMQSAARRERVWLLAGSVYEKIPGSPQAYNTSVLIGPKGQILARYRKRELFQARIDGREICEARTFRAGQRQATGKTGDFLLGMSICFDLRFPSLYQALSRKGCQVLAVPSSFTRPTGEAHWEILLRARAIETLSYVLAPNQAGKDANGVPSYGNSLIIDPWGRILARGSDDKEEILFAEVSLSAVRQARRKLPGIAG